MSGIVIFETGRMVSRETGTIFEAPFLHSYPQDPSNPVDSIQVDGRDLDVSPATFEALTKALFEISTLTRKGIRVDCGVFAVKLCGGIVSIDVLKRRAVPMSQTLSYRTVCTVESTSNETRVLEPTVLGKMTTRGNTPMLLPKHMAVRLNQEGSEYIQKFGDYSIGIASLDDVAQFYRVDTMGPVLSLRYRDSHHLTALSYKAPDANQTNPANTNTHILVNS